MKILNMMLSRGLGGIQQAFLDYDKALRSKKFELVNVSAVFADINHFINSDFKLLNLSPWDISSILYLKYIIKTIRPKAIIAHGNRAINFAKVVKSMIPLIGIAHNYGLTGLRKCDYVIALTKHMQEYLIRNNFADSKITIIPNMININKDFISNKIYRDPITIGTMARFIPKKGIDVFLQALHQLKEQGYNFKALIGGSGEEEEKLLSLSKKLTLDSYVSFTGWVRDKERFLQDIDIFCVPSLHEPFGIIILEAMEAGKPIISTRTEGAKEIIREGKDGLLCDAGSSSDLAEKIACLIDNPHAAQKCVQSAHERLKEHYCLNIVAKKLSEFLNLLPSVHV